MPTFLSLTKRILQSQLKVLVFFSLLSAALVYVDCKVTLAIRGMMVQGRVNLFLEQAALRDVSTDTLWR